MINTGCKISIIIDKALTISHKAVLIIYLKSEIQDVEDSVSVFIDLVELEGATSIIIFETIISVLEKHGFNEKYLYENLIGFYSDGASVTLGKKAGVSAKTLEIFPNISTCHCLAHCIQLSLDDVIKEVNNFRYFLNKLYVYYHTSNKHQRELNNISKELENEVQKIEIGIVSYLKNENFLRDLGLILDIIEEISILSTALQERNVSLIRADRLIRRTINVIQHLKLNKGTYEKEAGDIIKTKKYNIPFEINGKKSSIVFSRDKFYDSLVKHIKTRLLFDDINEKYNDLLNPETWQGDIW
ncbi:E3 SUMO-protein ligase KIAA1586-like [Hydra vulgaris]|uniref:E3 SUMO-protein ligase KIAA1586-like n=1 Tax=Hydra vulgaris TaxID=6087 RepID=A0ABM4BPG0_HYDVU